tara:strand:- start:2186 stop:2440 length:255 start_codon:yes stop_codon:yes gene_type:complete
MNSNDTITLDLGSPLESVDNEKVDSPSSANTYVFSKQDILDKNSSLSPIRNSPFTTGLWLHEYPAGFNSPPYMIKPFEFVSILF